MPTDRIERSTLSSSIAMSKDIRESTSDTHYHCAKRASIASLQDAGSESGGAGWIPADRWSGCPLSSPSTTPTPNMFGSNLTRAGYSQDANEPVRQTDSDAAIARLSAVKLGYLQDHFIRFLVQRPHLQPPRPPLINIGTYVRSEAIDRLVNEWLELSSAEGKKCQIVSMGAGSDTRFWRIQVRGSLRGGFCTSSLGPRGNVENIPR